MKEYLMLFLTGLELNEMYICYNKGYRQTIEGKCLFKNKKTLLFENVDEKNDFRHYSNIFITNSQAIVHFNNDLF